MTVLDLLWFLLPLAAASGWWAASRHARKAQSQHGDETNPVYFRGLNHLLNEEPDKAIDVFVEMLEVDDETVETHLALGNLFRRKGEVERAIRIHQNLIARPALSREQRGQALLELGLDYMRAGLYDRAENLFLELKEGRMHVEHALRNLGLIYQQEKDWEACLRTAEALETHTGENQSLEKSHYYCELAMRARRASQPEQAVGYLSKALTASPHCVRATHLMARFAEEQGDVNEALTLLHRAVDQDPEYMSEILGEISELYDRRGQATELKQYLELLVGRYPNRGAELLLADMIEADDPMAAASYLADYLRRTPSLQGLIRLVELQCGVVDVKDEHFLHNVRDQLTQLIAERSTYQCTQCGFHAKTLHWQCPSCRSWSTVKRRNLIEAES